MKFTRRDFTLASLATLAGFGTGKWLTPRFRNKDIAGEKKEIAWGSQIRSYVMQPYRMIKDHRTNFEVGNVDSTLDGNLDPFIKAYLLWQR